GLHLDVVAAVAGAAVDQVVLLGVDPARPLLEGGAVAGAAAVGDVERDGAVPVDGLDDVRDGRVEAARTARTAPAAARTAGARPAARPCAAAGAARARAAAGAAAAGAAGGDVRVVVELDAELLVDVAAAAVPHLDAQAGEGAAV